MATLSLAVVTAEQPILEQDCDFVVLPGLTGELGIYPEHAPLLTLLRPGALRVHAGGTVEQVFVSGGFAEVLPERVTVLADTAERAEEIDAARAQEARDRAERLLAQAGDRLQQAEAEAALQRALARLRLVETVRQVRRSGARRPRPGPPEDAG
jgi:F-type H+-transporting ATPase subunit epsilon